MGACTQHSKGAKDRDAPKALRTESPKATRSARPIRRRYQGEREWGGDPPTSLQQGLGKRVLAWVLENFEFERTHVMMTNLHRGP